MKPYFTQESDSMKTTLMTETRKRIELPLEWVRANAALLGYGQASDGVWVPKCDLPQYEAGGRPWA